MISPNDFPNGDAGAVRDLSFARIYEELGYEPIIICCNKNLTYGVYEGIEYYSYYLDAKTFIDKIIRYFKQKKLFVNIFKKVEKENGIPSLIHLYSASNNIIAFIKRYTHKHKIQILYDSVEWYSPCEFKYGKFDKAYIINNRLNTKVIEKPIKVIAISSFLKRHFESKGIECERIPVILDVPHKPINYRKDNKIKLIYAGSPAKKDYLKEIIEGVLGLSENEKNAVELNVYGITEEQLRNMGIVSQFEHCVIAHGRVNRTVVQNALEESDYSLLLRPDNERYTMAGFPTKSAEAMSNGVAMICNLTSDLGMYLEDGINSIIVNQCTAESMTTAIRRVLKLSQQDINQMKENAKKTAIENFDYRSWVTIVEKLIER